MSDQPEALRLADDLVELDAQFSYSGLCGEAATELRRLHDEIEQLKAERDALKAAAEKGTEYVLAHINQGLKAERDALRDAAVEFVRKVENGEARSVRSYAQFKAALDAAKGKP